MSVESRNSRDAAVINRPSYPIFPHVQKEWDIDWEVLQRPRLSAQEQGPISSPGSLVNEFWFRLPSTRACEPFAHNALRLNVLAE